MRKGVQALIELRVACRAADRLRDVRFQFFRLLYGVFHSVMVRDSSWQEPLLASISPDPRCRILSFGQGSVAIARTIALRFPDAEIVGADPHPSVIETARRWLVRNSIPNLMIMDVPAGKRLPLNAGSFDKVVLVLAFHYRMPEEKLMVAREMRRVLRHGGTLHVAACDKPSFAGEDAVLRITRYLSGPAAADSHLDGTWTEFLTKAGFVGIRRQSSQSVRVARISVVRARKP